MKIDLEFGQSNELSTSYTDVSSVYIVLLLVISLSELPARLLFYQCEKLNFIYLRMLPV